MTDAADEDTDETGPERMCIVTRDKGDPGGMVRFVVAPDGLVVPDIRARLPGRGAWVGGRISLIEMAIKRKAFHRAFKREVVAATGLAAQVEELLTRDALQALALANKAGRVVCGATKVEAAFAAGPMAALLHARDGRADGVRKMDAAVRRVARARGDHDSGAIKPVQFFSSLQLDLALGRSNVIHAALMTGGVSDGFLRRAARLARFREEPGRDEAAELNEPALEHDAEKSARVFGRHHAP